ncbi:MAG: TolC family protein [Dysgonamonadaceae bacterium]|nr:TolC family protein [Dysgonamonadaceae bacterium]
MNKLILLAAILFPALNCCGQELLTLQDCRNLAIENNKQLQIGKENIKKSQLEKKVAFTQYLPDISFTGTYFYNQKNLSLLESDKFLPIGTLMGDGSFGFVPDQINNQWTTINGKQVPLDADGQLFDPSKNPEKILWKQHTLIPKSEFEMDVKNVWAGTLSIVQPIFMGGKITAYNQITEYAEQLAESMQDAGLRDVIVKTDETYWQVISLINKKKMADGYVGLLKKMDHDVREMITEGFATKADGLSVRVKLNEAEMMQTKADNGLRLSKMLLSQLCGLPLENNITLADESITNFRENSSAVLPNVNDAFMNRPELKSLNLATKIYEKKEQVVRSEMLPKIALTGNYIVSNPNLFNGFQNEFAGMWNVGVVVNVPIFHWGERFHKLNAAKSETRIKMLELEEAKEKIELQVNQSTFKTNEAQKKLTAATKNMESAEENLRYATLGFEEGIIPVSNVMEAHTAWLQAKSGLIDSQIEYKLSIVYLNKAIGVMGRPEDGKTVRP